jgi:hypothetical protein
MMLIDRMQASYRDELKKQLEIYPFSLANLAEELSTKEFYTDMTYGGITHLVYLGITDFGPVSISELFNNK